MSPQARRTASPSRASPATASGSGSRRRRERSGRSQTLFNPSSAAACGGASKATELNCSMNVAGTWTITVQDAAGTRTGNYAIAIQRLNNPVGCTAISSGAAPTARSISSAAEMDCYTFSSVSTTQMMRVRVAETSGSLVARDDVARPNGTTVCGATTNLDLTCPLDATGTHTIVVSDNAGDQSGNYSIAIRRLDSTAGCTTLTFGAAPISRTIGAAAEMDCFQFSGVLGDTVTFRVTKNLRHARRPVGGAGSSRRDDVLGVRPLPDQRHRYAQDHRRRLGRHGDRRLQDLDPAPEQSRWLHATRSRRIALGRDRRARRDGLLHTHRQRRSTGFRSLAIAADSTIS